MFGCSIPTLLVIAQVRVNALAPIVDEPKVASDSQPALLIAIALSAIVVLAVGLTLSKLGSRRALNDSRRLFLELCRENQLSRRQRQLLLELSKNHGGSDPSQVLLNADLWQIDPAQSALLKSEKAQTELYKLRSLLFNRARHTPTLELRS